MDYLTIGTKDELENIKRPIEYGEKQSDYDKLHPFFQIAVDDTVIDLTRGEEYAGYNFDHIMKWVKSSDTRANQNKVLSEIINNNSHYVLYKDDIDYYNSMSEEKKRDYEIKYQDRIYRNIDTFRKSTSNSKVNTDLGRTIRLICDYFLVSTDVLLRGKGEIYSVKEKYINSISSDFVQSITRTDFSTKVAFQEYAKALGVPENEVIITEYAIIPKRGQYLLLSSGKRHAHLKKAVDDLIDRLLFIQNHKMMLGYPCSECSLCAGGCER